MKEAIASLRGLSMRYEKGGRRVLSSLFLEIPKGRILCLLGESGCGKTTTLQLIGGFLRPEEGEIWIDGTEISCLPPEKRPVSTVFQSYALFPHMTVLENVCYGLRFQGIPKREAGERGREILSLVGLSGCEDRLPSALSGGQQQRVALARALAVRPKLLLMDEPLSNLDAGLRVRIREELKELQRKLSMSILFVTHDQEEALSLGDEIALMREGRLLQCDTPEEVYNHPADRYVCDFFGKSNEIRFPGGEGFLIRPEKIGIRRRGNSEEEEEEGKGAGEEIRLFGEIQSTEFFGFYREYRVLSEGRELLVRSPSAPTLSPEEKVTLFFRREDSAVPLL